MLKKSLLFFSILHIFFSSGDSSIISVPNQFSVIERLISLTTSFDIKTSKGTIGYVKRTFLSLRKEYEFYNSQDELLATAKMRWFNLTAIFDIIDVNDQPLGYVKEHFFTVFPTFSLFSPHDEKLAIAEMNFWKTKYLITDPDTHQEIATLSRPFLRIKDNWSVHITGPDLLVSKKIDPRLFITVMAFQTDYESWQKD